MLWNIRLVIHIKKTFFCFEEKSYLCVRLRKELKDKDRMKGLLVWRDAGRWRLSGLLGVLAAVNDCYAADYQPASELSGVGKKYFSEQRNYLISRKKY